MTELQLKLLDALFFFKQLKEFFWRVKSYAECQEVLFIPCDNAVTFVGLGTGRHQAIFKILCFNLKGIQDIIIGYRQDAYDVKDGTDDFVGVFRVSKRLAGNVKNVGDGRGGNKSLDRPIFAEGEDSL